MNHESSLAEEANIKEAVSRLFHEHGRLGQGDLFGGASLNGVLEDLFSLIRQGKSLYQRWTQRIGDKERKLSVPNKSLRRFLDSYLLDFIRRIGVHERCHGGERGWSPKTSLETHLPCSSALSFDLKSAFENVSYRKVYDFFNSNLPETLSEEEKDRIAKFFSLLCTVEYSEKRGLPQGSSASMALFNRTLYHLDLQLSKEAEERGFRYSRWVDDMVISSPSRGGAERFLGAVELTLRDFPVSEEKIFFQNTEFIYLLGYKINGRQISKNTREEKERNKTKPLNFDEWFSGERRYEPWS